MQITSIPQTGAGGGASPPGAAGGAIGALELPALSGGGGGMSDGGVGEGGAPGAMQPDAKKIKAATAKMAANFAIPMRPPQSSESACASVSFALIGCTALAACTSAFVCCEVDCAGSTLCVPCATACAVDDAVAVACAGAGGGISPALPRVQSDATFTQ